MAGVNDFSSFINLANKSASPILATLEHPPVQKAQGLHAATTVSTGPPFFQTLFDLLRHPQRILFLWNWKSAWLSIILRAPIFLGVTVRRGFHVSFSAVLIECLYCALTAGFYGAVVQNLRDAEPQWLTILFLTLVLPGIFQVFEFLLHRLHGTPHLKIAEIVSIAVSAVSALFNWYAMRRGALLVGGEGRSFGSDLRRLPGLIVAFITALPRSWGNQGKNA